MRPLTKLEITLRELGEIHEFAKAIRPYRITPEIIKASDDLKKIPHFPEPRLHSQGLTLCLRVSNAL